MVRLSFNAVAFAHQPTLPILSNATFHLGPGWTGLVGENGAGKTTLLSLATGALTPDRGTVQVEPKGARVLLCPQVVDDCTPEIADFSDATDGASRAWMGRLELYGAPLWQWATLSPGQKKRWQLGAALALQPDILLLDEPTNHVDDGVKTLVVDALRSFRGLGVMVGHDRAVLDALTQKTLRVHRGDVTLWNGNHSTARTAWEADEAHQRERRETLHRQHRALDRRLKDERRVQAQAHQAIHAGARIKDKHDSDARSSGSKNLVSWAEARLGKNAAATQARLSRVADAMEGFKHSKHVGRPVHFVWERAPQPVLVHLKAEAVRAGEVPLLHHVDVTLHRDARVHLAGANGEGKTTLIHALLGQSRLPQDKVLFLPQDLDADARLRARAAVEQAPQELRGRLLSLLAAWGVDPARLVHSATPSPGEAKKLLLARALLGQVWLLVLDEPTNHLDLPGVERLEQALVDYPGALLVTSHDATFARAVTRETWTVHRGRVTPDALRAGIAVADSGVEP